MGNSEPLFREALVGLAREYIFHESPPMLRAVGVGPKKVKRQEPGLDLSIIAYAYEITGEPVYAAYCGYILREQFPKALPGFSSMCYGSLVPPLMEAVRRAEARFGRDRLELEEKRWLEWAEGEGRDQEAIGRPNLPDRSLGAIRGYER